MKKINRSITAFVVIGLFLLSCSVLLLGIGCANTSMKGSMNNVDTLHFNETIYENEDKIGVLVIAHGSPNNCWCQPIRETVENVSLPYPTKLGFLEFVENESIGNAIEELDNLGADKIIAVPLFISSYSGHIQEIEYVLKLVDNPPSDEELIQVDTPAEIIFTRAMDDHPLVAYMLADQIVNLSRTTTNATAVILSHGTEDEKNLLSQINCQDALAYETKTILKWWGNPATKVEDVKYAFIHLNETIHPELTPGAVVENASLEGDVVVLPLMISEGFFTERRIPQLLEGQDYEYNGYALAPHPNMARWIETSVRCAIGREKNGVLIIDHGSLEKERVNAVRKLVNEIELYNVPIALAFAEHPPKNESISAGIAKLIGQGSNNIIAVTLFTTPTTDHEEVREQVYLALQNIDQTKIFQSYPTHMGVRVTVTGPIDDHPLIAGVLLDRAREVSEKEYEETLVICPWGDSRYFEYSELHAKTLTEQIKMSSNFSDVRYGFMGCQGSPNIRQTVDEVQDGGPVIVVTVNSMGSDYVDGLISQKLEGLNYTYNGKGFYGYSGNIDPHQNIARWIEFTISKAMR